MNLFSKKKTEDTEGGLNKVALFGTYCRTYAFDMMDGQGTVTEFMEARAVTPLEWEVRKCRLERDGVVYYDPVPPARQPLIHALHNLARYEDSQPEIYKVLSPEKVWQDHSNQHFREFAHREGIVFDTEQKPHLVKDGVPVTGKSFLPEEIKAAKLHDTRPSTIPVFNMNAGSIFKQSDMQGRHVGLQKDLTNLCGFIALCAGTIEKAHDGFLSKDHYRVWGQDVYYSSLLFLQFKKSITHLMSSKALIQAPEVKTPVDAMLLNMQLLLTLWTANHSRAYTGDWIGYSRGEKYCSDPADVKKYLNDPPLNWFNDEYACLEQILKETGADDQASEQNLNFVLRSISLEDYKMILAQYLENLRKMHEAANAYRNQIQSCAVAQPPAQLNLPISQPSQSGQAAVAMPVPIM